MLCSTRFFAKVLKEFNYEKNCVTNRERSTQFQRQIEKAMGDDSVSLSMYTNTAC